ncbi:hypothetical protein AAFN88_01670 [Pelagibius sp. CAU 1746]|uniref:hypothetical protein n=1 Tax=Pelagibius sp. CAU 1746 TaxID=3140370 RepID=UPI00325B52EE
MYGALKLARFDAAGAQYFDESRSAALRSFFAAVLVAPAYFLRYPLAPEEMVAHHEFTVLTALADILTYSLIWTVFPVVAYHICQAIGRERAFFRFLSAKNWSTVITSHLSLLMMLLAIGGALSPGIVALLVLLGGGYMLGYIWFLTKTCLDISSGAAAGFLVLQIVIEFFVVSFVAVLIG